MTENIFEESLNRGLDAIASENKLGNVTTQLVSRYSGIPEAKMLRHIPSLDRAIEEWFTNKIGEIESIASSFNKVKSKTEFLHSISSIIESPHLLTLLVAKNIDQSIEEKQLSNIRDIFRNSIFTAINCLQEKPDRSDDELADEVMYMLFEIGSSTDQEVLRKKNSLKKNLPWESECDLFPSEDIIRRLAISESGFVFDPVSGKSYSANESALAILKILQQTTDIGEITTLVIDEYDVSNRTAERDILEFAASLRNTFS